MAENCRSKKNIKHVDLDEARKKRLTKDISIRKQKREFQQTKFRNLLDEDEASNNIPAQVCFVFIQKKENKRKKRLTSFHLVYLILSMIYKKLWPIYIPMINSRSERLSPPLERASQKKNLQFRPSLTLAFFLICFRSSSLAKIGNFSMKQPGFLPILLWERKIRPRLVFCFHFLSKNETQSISISHFPPFLFPLQEVVSSGIVPVIFKLLIPETNIHVLEQVIWTLGNIAGDCISMRNLLLSQNAVTFLLSLLEKVGPILPQKRGQRYSRGRDQKTQRVSS